MARLIDVDEFNKLIAIECANSVKRRVSQLYREGLLTAKLLMDICKTVDAVQIVRCNDCKYWSAAKSKENEPPKRQRRETTRRSLTMRFFQVLEEWEKERRKNGEA